MEKIKNVDKYLSVNQKVLIDVLSGEYQGTYDSRIEDYHSKAIVLSMPSDKGVGIPIREKTRLSVNFIAEGGRFSFESTVARRYKNGAMALMDVARPEYIIRRELREYFRVETRLKIKIKYIKNPESETPEEVVIDGNIVDISGGGVKVSTDFGIPRETNVVLDVSETPIELDEISCMVVRSIKILEKHQLGIIFDSISNGERDKIIKYVFQRQLELRKLLG